MKESTPFSGALESIGLKRGHAARRMSDLLSEFTRSLLGHSEDEAVLATHGFLATMRPLLGQAYLVDGVQLLRALESDKQIPNRVAPLGVIETDPTADAANWTKSPEEMVHYLTYSPSWICDGNSVYRLSGETKFSLNIDGENTKHEIFAGQTLTNEAAVWFGTMAEFKTVGVDSRKALLEGTDPNWKFRFAIDVHTASGAQQILGSLLAEYQ